MKVAMVTPCFFGHDGVGNTIRDYLDAFAEWGWQADIYHRHSTLVAPPGVGNHFLNLTSLVEERLGGGSGTFLDHDVFIFQYVFHYPLIEAIRAVDRGRVVVEYHGITPPHFFPLQDPYRRLAEDMLTRHALLDYADAVVVHSRSMRQELLGLYPLPASSVRVLPLGVAPHFSSGPPSRDIRSRYDLGKGPLLLYVGRLSGNKRVDVLVRAMVKVKRLHPAARLVLIGEFPRSTTSFYVEKLESLARRLGVRSSLSFIPSVSDDELADFYRTAALFVTGSLHEGFCIPVAEAMACGLPAVVPRISATPETLGTGGLTYAPECSADCAATIARLLADPGKRADLARQALTEAKRHTATAFQERLGSLLQNVLSEPKRSRVHQGSAIGLLGATATPDVCYADACPPSPLRWLVRWFRRKMTLPLEVSCIRELGRRQGIANQLLAQEIERLEAAIVELRGEEPPGRRRPSDTRDSVP